MAIDASHWVLRPDILQQSTTVTTSEEALSEFRRSYRPGRRSFRKFNVAVEKMHGQIEEKEKMTQLEREAKRDTVSDEEMTNR